MQLIPGNHSEAGEGETMITVNQDLIDLLTLWKKQHLWKGSIEGRKNKFQWMHEHMKVLFNKPNLRLIIRVSEKSDKTPGSSAYSSYGNNRIVLSGRLSVITFLHEWGHVLLGHDEDLAVEWSNFYFKKVFPLSAKRLVKGRGIMKYKQGDKQ